MIFRPAPPRRSGSPHGGRNHRVSRWTDEDGGDSAKTERAGNLRLILSDEHTGGSMGSFGSEFPNASNLVGPAARRAPFDSACSS